MTRSVYQRNGRPPIMSPASDSGSTSSLLDTIGVPAKSWAGLKILLTNRPDVTRILTGLADAIKSRNSALVALEVERLFATVFSGETLTAIESVVGKEELKRILSTFAARFVPFIGWGLWVISFLIAIHKNWANIKPLL